MSLLSCTHSLSRTWHLHQKTTSGQCCPASTAADGIRRVATFIPFCPWSFSHPVGRLVTLPASSSLDRVATQPSGHRTRPIRFAASMHTFASLAGSACTLAHGVAATAHTQCSTTYGLAHRDDHLWALIGVCPDPGFASRLSWLRTLNETHPRLGFSRREGPFVDFRSLVSQRSHFLPNKITLLFSFSSIYPFLSLC